MSVYAFSAALSGLLAAGFADRFDRKRLLLFFYSGFIAGHSAVRAGGQLSHAAVRRAWSPGLFGGVVGSVVMAIVTDLFALEMRGRVMGFMQTAFAASQILGLPAGMYLRQSLELACAVPGDRGPGGAGGLVIALRMKPVNGASGPAPGTQPLPASGQHPEGAALSHSPLR